MRIAWMSCLVALALGGCASWSRHGVAARPPEKIRIAVLPVRVAVAVRRLRSVETVPKPEKRPADEKERIALRLDEASNEITAELEARLASSYFFAVAPDSAARVALIRAGVLDSTSTRTTEQLQAAGRELGVQAVLATDLSGYGSIKKRWLFYLIGSGLAEGLAEGVAAATVVGSPWAAAGIGAEEAGQESAEWGGGAWFFGKYWSPVILEGKLVSVADGATVWSKTALESENRKELKKLSKEEQAKREVRLRLTARRAADALIKKLDEKAWRSLRKAEPRPR